MIQTKTTMTLYHFHDFYALQALQAAVISEIARNPDQQFRHAVEKLQMDIQDAIDTIIPNMAKRTFVYLYAACFGEARHSRSHLTRDIFITETITRHRNECFADIASFEPTRANLNALVTCFAQPWKSGYGGNSWKQIAEALLKYGKIPDTAWIDHVVDLEHNNGTAFNKEDARNTIYFDVEYPRKFADFLDYKFSKDILGQPMRDPYNDIVTLLVTRKVKSLIQRLEILFGRKEAWWFRASLPSLTDYDVEWGNETLHAEEKWLPWVNVSHSNEPDVDALISVGRIFDIYPPSNTRKQVKTHLKKAMKNAKKTAGKFATTKLMKETKEKVWTWYNDNKAFCKPEKCEITYEILPVSAHLIDDGKLELVIPMPFQGVGEPCENGFKIIAPYISYMTFGGWKDAHVRIEYGTIMLYIDGAAIQVQSKELEALLD